MPPTSIAANDPYFRNILFNNWSGQPEGLTYQRAISALENYGHVAEVTLIGKKLLDAITFTKKITQQFDPFTAEQNGADGYGPTILSVLEYYSRRYGVYPKNDTIHFNGLPAAKAHAYTQKIDNGCYKLVQKNGQLTGFCNSREISRSTAGVKVMTDKAGNCLALAGIDTLVQTVYLTIKGKRYSGQVKPNGWYGFAKGKIKLLKQVPFNYPYQDVDKRSEF